MILSPDQQKAHDAIVEFFKARRPMLRLGGFAGTGKTTIISEVVKRLQEAYQPRVAFCAYTGKAANVMRGKLDRAAVHYDYVGTIHRLIYSVEQTPEGLRWTRKPFLSFELIVVDEASMVNETIEADLRSYGIPILYVGDHGQLPPIEGRLNLMDNPDLRLEQIHRQAADNPIIQLSMKARLEGRIAPGRYGDCVNKILPNGDILDKVEDLGATMFLCGYNRTRVELNKRIRRRLGFDAAFPMRREKVICLRNKAREGLFNGMLGVLEEDCEPRGDHWYWGNVKLDGEPVNFYGRMVRAQFGSEKTIMSLEGVDPKVFGGSASFDWGYAMTVHKSQGSESPRVVVLEERMPRATDDDWRRWLYTAVTRSSDRLLIVGR